MVLTISVKSERNLKLSSVYLSLLKMQAINTNKQTLKLNVH